MKIATFNLQVLSPEPETYRGFTAEQAREFNRTDKRLLADLPAMLEAVEEDLTDLLPPGYSARITEWSDEA